MFAAIPRFASWNDNINERGCHMTVMVWTYLAYLFVTVALTIWVARVLHHNGRVFLIDSFGGNEPVADSVNRLLVVGFYLINVGAVALALKYGKPADSVQSAMEYLGTKIGLVLVILGVMHFLNLYIFSRMRRRALRRHEIADVLPVNDRGERDYVNRLGSAKRNAWNEHV
jgi:hypothetical protein